MRRFVGVLLEFDAAVNPEPGVARAPTIAEQVTALARLAERLGGRLEQELLIARRGNGLDSAALDHLVSLPVDGVLLFSLDTLRDDSRVDLKGLRRCWQLGGRLALLVEDLQFLDATGFASFIDFVLAMNLVRRRDSSAAWFALVNEVSAA
jgi:hypothetical protein